MGVPGGFAYCIYDTAKKTSTWVGINEPGNDFVVKAADPARESVTVDFQGRSLQLVLRTAKVSSSGAAPGPPAASAVASSVVLNPSMADEQRRLDAVAQEVRRRRARADAEGCRKQNSAPSPLSRRRPAAEARRADRYFVHPPRVRVAWLPNGCVARTALSGGPSNSELIRRLFRLAGRYRLRCLQVLGIQLVLLTMGLFGLSFTGVGIDYIRQVVGQAPGAAATAQFHFLHLSLPASLRPMHVLVALGGMILLLSACRAVLNYVYAVQVNILVQQNLVVDLRAEIYDKLQRLSFRFFDANTTGSIITRVTGDVQSVRMFVDQVLIQSVIMVISLTIYAIYMASLSPGLTVACLATTPLLWVLATRFSRKIQPEYAENRTLVERMVQYLAESVQGVGGRQGLRARGGEPRAIRGAQSAGPDPAVQHLLAGQPLLADGRLPDADQHDRAPRLRRLAGGPRPASPRRGPRRVRRAPRPVRGPGEQRGHDRQLGPAVAHRGAPGVRDPRRPDRRPHRRPTRCAGPAWRARCASRACRSSTAASTRSAGHRPRR